MADWYLYMVRCHDGSLYTGISTAVVRRFSQHEGKGDSGSRYLKGRGPLTLVFQKRLGSRSLALKVESKVKKLSKENKERLIVVPGLIEGIVSQTQASPAFRVSTDKSMDPPTAQVREVGLHDMSADDMIQCKV